MAYRPLVATTLALALACGAGLGTGCARKPVPDVTSPWPVASREATAPGPGEAAASATTSEVASASGANPGGSSGGTGSGGARRPSATTVPRDGSLFGFITASRPSGNGGAELTFDVAELHPTDESAAPGSAGEVTNPVVDAVAITAPASARVVTGPPGYEQLTISEWLASVATSTEQGTELARSAYWIEFKNGQVAVVRLQPLP